MKPFAAKTTLTVFIVLAVQGGSALANPIYFDYQSQVSPAPNAAPTINGQGEFTPASPAGNGWAAILAESGTHVAGSGSIIIADLSWRVDSDPSDPFLNGKPSTFNAQPFNLALTLTDAASHAQGTLHFQGTFSGTPWGDGSRGTLGFTPSIQTLVLGHNTYTVDLSQLSLPSWVDQETWMMGAAFGGGHGVPAQITVQPLAVQPAPEPTSLTLAALGTVMIVLSGLHRGRRRKLIRL